MRLLMSSFPHPIDPIATAAAYIGGAFILSAIFPVVTPLVALTMGAVAFVASGVFQGTLSTLAARYECGREKLQGLNVLLAVLAPIVAYAVVFAALTALSISFPITLFLIGAAITVGLGIGAIIISALAKKCCPHPLDAQVV
jgi:hypothetical protein